MAHEKVDPVALAKAKEQRRKERESMIEAWKQDAAAPVERPKHVWSVSLLTQRTVSGKVLVRAEWVTIDQGCLVFTDTVDGPGGGVRSKMVMAFAPGTWGLVEIDNKRL